MIEDHDQKMSMRIISINIIYIYFNFKKYQINEQPTRAPQSPNQTKPFLP